MNLQNQIDFLKNVLDQDMFDDCSVPAGLNMQRVRGAIVMRCGLLTPLYSEPETQRAATQQFFFENQWNFEHIVKILQAEYSPIENVAEWRTERTHSSGTDTLTISRGTIETHSGTDARIVQESGTTKTEEGGTTKTEEGGTTKTEEGGTTKMQEGGTTQDSTSYGKTSTHEISAENSTTYQADNREALSGTDTETITHGKNDTTTHGRTNTTTHGHTDTTTHGHTDTVTHGKGTQDDFTHGEIIKQGGSDTHTQEMGSGSDHEMNRHGNVGVTTNQEMINQELDLLDRFNPYKFIADLYEKELMIGLY